MLLEIHPKQPQERLIRKIVDVLQSGGLIAYPTDTTYGIGCSIYAKKSIERIYKIKRYPASKLLSIVCTDISDISKYACISDTAYRNMRRIFPGPYTCVLPATKQVPKLLSSKRKEIGIRIPDNHICQAIVKELGHPLLSAGAGDSTSELTALDPYHIEEQLGHSLDLVVDGGVLDGDRTTIIKFDGQNIDIMREGKGLIDFI